MVYEDIIQFRERMNVNHILFYFTFIDNDYYRHLKVVIN